ncbi:MAG: ribosome small subunit-dependent GTPase A [Candidatus Epulonipiscioides saccharophilum]|nr:MAG: ribosome small subunit-dependent GTPase A [Epulopiscium sp. AS2M-Bin001]
MKGKIIKGIAGFFYVEPSESNNKLNDKPNNKQIYECKARGKFRNSKQTPLIGDLVEISTTYYEGSEKGDFLQGTIDEILPRKNQLFRPSVANVDQGIIVFSLSYPTIHLDLLDRFLIMMAAAEIDAIIVLNKLDEAINDQYKEIVEGYRLTGYNVLCTSAKDGHINEVKNILKDKTSFFAGPSGVGKSTLLNTICPNFHLETGKMSEKIKRGKHTTRHTELLNLTFGGYVLDTPGFTSLKFEDIDINSLKNYFIEFAQYEGQCKFNGCTHTHEPNCAVKNAVNSGQIYKARYDSYVNYFKELQNIKKW